MSKKFKEDIKKIIKEGITKYQLGLANIIEEAYKKGKIKTVEDVVKLLRG